MNKRIFDIIKLQVDKYPQDPMLTYKIGGEWLSLSYQNVWDQSTQLANGLCRVGIHNGDHSPLQLEKIGIISPNRPEWIVTDLAVQRTGAVLTPIYPTISPHELQYILEDAKITKLFISGRDQVNRFGETLAQLPQVQHIYTFDKIDGYQHWETIFYDHGDVDTYSQLIKSTQLATLIYTSGTTGAPKGVMLSHDNIVANVADCKPVFSFAYRGAKALSFLPLNHIFERTVSYVYFDNGLNVAFAENMDTIGANLLEVKPIVFITVPRLLEKVYDKILAKGLDLKGLKRFIFFWALRLAKQYDNNESGGWWYNLQMGIADKLVFNKWRAALGGNVVAVVSGSAPLQERLARIFSAAKITVMEGYGLTETSPVVSVNRLDSAERRFGTVGPAINNVQIKIANDGEILIKGHNVMMGYFKNDTETQNTITEDGWLHTGDIGEMVDNHFLKITDRKKEMFKTSGGKYVAPSIMEGKLKESPFIEQVLIIGNNRKYVTSLIVINYVHVSKWLKDNKGIEVNSMAEATQLPETYQLIKEQVNKYNTLFSQPEQVKKFALVGTEWSIDGGELTPSLKVKRKTVEEKYVDQINKLYPSQDIY